MRVSRMKQCSAFVINHLFLWCFQQYKGLRFSKLTLSQMGNKTEQHTQKCFWYCFFHLICIHCIHVARWPSVLLWFFFFFFFKKTSSAASDAWLVQDQAVLHLSLFLSPHEAPLLSSPFWSVFSLFFASTKAHQWLAMPPIFTVCWANLPAFQLQDLHILTGRKILEMRYRTYIQTLPLTPLPIASCESFSSILKTIFCL